MKEKREKISILGCGWLGLPLAKNLIAKDYDVKGSTTSVEKINQLKLNQIEPFLISLFENKIEGNIQEFLNNSEIIIINIPPNLRNSTNENFVKKINLLISEIEKSEIKKVIFISSTSVYRDEFPIVTVDEQTLPNPDNESGKQLAEIEKILLENKSFQSIIIRFGGLIGEDRNPIHFLAGRKNIQNPNAPVNLIHQEDCIGVIVNIVEKGLRQAQSDNKTNNKILKQVQYDNLAINAVYPFHPTRKEYYSQKAKELNLEIPEFSESEISKGKIIKSKILINDFAFNFCKPI